MSAGARATAAPGSAEAVHGPATAGESLSSHGSVLERVLSESESECSGSAGWSSSSEPPPSGPLGPDESLPKSMGSSS